MGQLFGQKEESTTAPKDEITSDDKTEEKMDEDENPF